MSFWRFNVNFRSSPDGFTSSLSVKYSSSNEIIFFGSSLNGSGLSDFFRFFGVTLRFLTSGLEWEDLRLRLWLRLEFSVDLDDFSGTGDFSVFRRDDLRSTIIGDGDRDFFFGVGERFFLITWTCLPEYFSESDGDEDLEESDDLARFFGFDFSWVKIKM